MRVVGVACVLVFCVACGSPGPGTSGGPAPEQAKPAAPAAGPAAKPYGSLAQMMRAIPFPNSNIIFDAQTKDPGAVKKPAEGAKPGAGASATETFSGVYGGWQAVESASLAIAETANLIMIPGRLCENGKPVPLDREDFRKAVQGLADAGMAAYKAAQTKSQDAMVEVAGTVADACAVCHEVYRDKPDNKDRCVP